MNEHCLKTWPEFFEAVNDGRKTFEIRRTDDRTFAVNDLLRLEEWSPETKTYTGRALWRRVTYVLAGAPWLPDGLAALGLSGDLLPGGR